MLEDIALPGSSVISGRMLECVQCKKEKPREGGVERRPGQFVCRNCWRLAAVRSRNGHRQDP